MQVHFKIHGQGKKNLNGDGLAIWYTKERMQKGKIKKKKAPKQKLRAILFKNYYNLISCLLKVPCLEIWTTLPASACLWTRIPTRRNIWRYVSTRLHNSPWRQKADSIQISEGRSKPFKKWFSNILKKMCLFFVVVVFCCNFASGPEETIHSSHTGTFFRPELHWPAS